MDQDKQGIEIAPDYYIDLSNRLPTLEERIRHDVDKAMRAAKFKYQVKLCENLIVEALFNARTYRASPYHSYLGKKLTRMSFGTTRPRNRDHELQRFYLLGVLYRVWMLGTRQKPVINNRGSIESDFIQFIRKICFWFRIGKLIPNLERFESYRKAILLGQSYIEWRKVRPRKVRKSTGKTQNQVVVPTSK